MRQRHRDSADGRRVVGMLMWLCLLPGLSAADTDVDRSPAADALGDTIWFDAEQDVVIAVEVKPQEDDSLNRDSRWLPQAKRVRVPDAPTATGGGLFGTGLTILNLLGWLLLVALVASAAILIAFALSKSDFDSVVRPGARASRREEGPDEQTLERIKHLPPELRRTDVNLRNESVRLMGQQEYDQAVILLYAHQLLLLDRAQLLRLHRGKTNRRYVRETRSIDRESSERLEATVQAFERSYFGRHSISADEFTRLWADNVLLEQRIEQRKQTAA